MGSITQPPARKFDYREIESKFSRRIIAVLFASKLVMEQINASKQRNAETAMEIIINRFAQTLTHLRKITETRIETKTGRNQKTKVRQ